MCAYIDSMCDCDKGYQIFQCFPDVQDGLHSGWDHSDRSSTEFCQVSTHIQSYNRQISMLYSYYKHLLTVTNTQHLNPKLKGTIFFLLAQTVLHYKELTVLYPVWNLTIAWYLNFGWPFEIALSIKYGKIIQLKSWQCLFKIEPPQNLDIPNLLIKTSVMCCIQQICFGAFVFWILWKYVWK